MVIFNQPNKISKVAEKTNLLLDITIIIIIIIILFVVVVVIRIGVCQLQPKCG